MEINVRFNSIEEMDAWVARMGNQSAVAKTEIVFDKVEYKEEKPKATTTKSTTKKKSAPKATTTTSSSTTTTTKPQIVKNEQPVEKETEVTETGLTREEQAQQEVATEPMFTIKDPNALVAFLQQEIKASTSLELKKAFVVFDGGIPSYIEKHFKDYEKVVTRSQAVAVMNETLGL